ncbi:hypothetical protein [Microaceticoccus formicicus]|uniref:hypothetical protein n=1 Tax=Microaceticoccus formicicus TaxID=3118105 RepID=UPI003CD02189|nr:hypothetical protein VZL98_01355 [Peptoniphilaceae bacterium AMB_02]
MVNVFSNLFIKLGLLLAKTFSSSSGYWYFKDSLDDESKSILSEYLSSKESLRENEQS